MCSQTFLSAKTDILDFRIKLSPFVSPDNIGHHHQYVNIEMRNKNIFCSPSCDP